MTKLLSVGQVADLLGVSTQTVRRWTKESGLECYRTSGNDRRFSIQQLEDFLGYGLRTDDNKNRQAVWGYARSSSGRDTSLESQSDLIKQHYTYTETVITDKASGLNENRKGLQKLIKAAKEGQYNVLVITNKDRLTRFGYTYLTALFESHGVEVITLQKTTDASPETELLADFMSLLASFSGKFYRLRGLNQQRMLLNKAENELNDGS